MRALEESRLNAEDRTARVNGGRVLIFGDLHISSSYEGQHISYMRDCYENMELIKNICSLNKPRAVIFLGDIIGVNERSIRDRQFFMRVLQFFYFLNDLCEDGVYSVKGNHDAGDFTDFDFLIGLGLIRNPRYLDYYSEMGNHEVRFHFVNYGYERNSLSITEPDEGVSNVVLGHADYYIDGVTNWYSARNGVELGLLDNFCGVELVISGHIHIPSDQILYTNLKDGSAVGLFYTGSPARTAERFDDCWYVKVEYTEDEDGNGCTNCDPILMGLKKAEEVFYPKESFELETEEDEEQVQSEKLTELVKEIIESRITTLDIVNQIMINPIADKETKELAVEYYQRAERGE